MKIALDVMGFENDTAEAIKAARKFSKKFTDTKIVLVGDIQQIIKHLKIENEFEIVNSTQVITMEDNPIHALRKIDSSMYKAIKLVKTNHVDGVLSAGSTSCFVPMVYSLMGLIEGIKKTPFMPFIPTVDKVGFNMLDVGANINVTGGDLYQFALMGNIYAKEVRKIANPKIGIVNIGTEHHKGFEYHREAYDLLKADSRINFIGFVEPKYLIAGSCDVAVCDGYTGNITLKSLEGSFRSVAKILGKSYKKPWNWLGALFSIGTIKSLVSTFDFRNNAGALVLGAKGVAVKTHGSADSKQFYSSLCMTRDAILSDITNKIKEQVNVNK